MNAPSGKTCEYCHEDKEGFKKMFGAFSLINPFHSGSWQICAKGYKSREIYSKEIYFCPMCGRKLT